MTTQTTKDGCITVHIDEGVFLTEVRPGNSGTSVFLGDSRGELQELSAMLKSAALELPEEES